MRKRQKYSDSPLEDMRLSLQEKHQLIMDKLLVLDTTQRESTRELGMWQIRETHATMVISTAASDSVKDSARLLLEQAHAVVMAYEVRTIEENEIRGRLEVQGSKISESLQAIIATIDKEKTTTRIREQKVTFALPKGLSRDDEEERAIDKLVANAQGIVEAKSCNI